MSVSGLNRRDFLVTGALAGGGLAIGFTGAAKAAPWAYDGAGAIELSPWIEIGRDDSVTIRVPQPEIGNGATTQVAMNIAEELNCDWKKVRIESASMLRNHLESKAYDTGFLGFFGGHGTDEARLKKHLQLGASARERLRAAAAQRWKVPLSDVEAKNGLLIHKSGKKLRYGEVAAEASAVRLEEEPKPKPRSEWRLLGKSSPPKLNIPDIVSGKAIYGIDVRLPGMVYAALMQSPVHGGKLKSHKPEAALKMPGVRAVVVVDPANTKGSPVKQKSTFGYGDSAAQWGVAVIADHYWQAKKALDALPVEWDDGPAAQWVDEKALYDEARKLLVRSPNTKVALKKGDIVKTDATRVLNAEYGTPYGDTAVMEPLNATVLVTADSAEAWAPTQDTQQAYWTVIDETGLAPEKVKLHATLVGGGFGRRGQGDDLRMAVAVARQFPDRPVKTIWSREETFRQGRYRTPIIAQYGATLDEKTGLPQTVVGTSVYIGTSQTFQLPFGFSDQPYFNSGIIPNVLLLNDKLPNPIMNGAFRGPCYNSHCFNLETFIDECAVKAGIDPLDYRLKLLEKWDKSWSDCLRVAAQKAGWGKKLPKGEGLGLAISAWPVANILKFGSVIATVARVSVSKEGTIAVKQIDVAFDCGSVANPDAVRAQVEGATLFGMNAALHEELTIKDGAIVEGNFDAYPMIRLADTPPVNVHFDALTGHNRMQIMGEAPVGPIQPAIGNAIYAAIGKRLRRTPFVKHDLSW